MWNDWSTDAYDGMIAELISMKGDGGDTVNAYLSRPLGPGPYPGIVLVHHLPGWDELYREMARRLSQHGYVVICPNLYQRFGHGTPEEVAAMARGARPCGASPRKPRITPCGWSIRCPPRPRASARW